MAGLLPAEDAALLAKRLEHGTGPRRRSSRRVIPRSAMSRWKPRFAITVTATRSTPKRRCEDREDPVAVDDHSALVHCEHAIAVAVERIEVEAPRLVTVCLQSVGPLPHSRR